VSLDELPVRDDLRGKKPYGAPQIHVPIQLNVNENTHPVPPAVAADIATALGAALTNINRYPDREFTELREALAGYVGGGVDADNLWAANGSNEVLQQILQAFGGPGRNLLGFPPTYSMYPLLAEGTGTAWVTAERGPDFAITPDIAVAAIRANTPDITVFCAPNNPTGTGVALDTIAAAYDATDGIVIVDEAYHEFMPDSEPRATELLAGRPRLLISRTMSKAFAFAGARVGYLVAHPDAIDALRLVRLPYHLSALTQAAGTTALRHAPTMLGMVDDIRTQRDRIVRELAGLGYTPHASQTNFVLFGGVDDPHAVFTRLLEDGIIIRDVGIPNHLRVSAGTEAETTAFLDALARISRER
jgi:histidinol-phosphate aminotransferase